MGLGSLIPKVVPLVSPILLPRTISSLAFQPSPSACHKVVRLFWCVEELEDVAASACCVIQDVPQGDLKALWPQQSFHHINIHHELGRKFPNILPKNLSPFFRLGSNRLSAPSLADAADSSPWCSFVFVPSRPLSHQETHVIRTGC